MKGSSHITTILGNEIIVVGGGKGWCSVIQMHTGASVIFPATVELYAAFCLLSHCDINGEIFHRLK